MALEYFHEPREQLPPMNIEQHRALASLIEELEAANWYNERAANTSDQQLKAIIEHNRDEEIEHATMLLEWLRRNFPGFDEQMKTYLFTSKPITELENGNEEQSTEPGNQKSTPGDGSLNIGPMR